MTDTVTIGSVLLCEPGDALTFDDLTGARQVQVAALLRAADITLFDRGNRALTLTITRTRRPHASANAARLFMADHEQALAALSGTYSVVFVFEGPSGTVTRYLRGALVASHRARQSGFTTFHTYTLQGTAWSATAS